MHVSMESISFVLPLICKRSNEKPGKTEDWMQSSKTELVEKKVGQQRHVQTEKGCDWPEDFSSPSSQGCKRLHERACVLSHFSCVRLFGTLWTVQSMGVSRQEYWTGLPCPHPGDLPNPGIKPQSLTSTCIGRWALYH